MTKVIITSPSLDPHVNVSGVSAVVKLIIQHNLSCEYVHFSLGKKDMEKRDLGWLIRNLGSWFRWMLLLARNRGALIHFNLALGKRSLLRDVPLIILSKLFGYRMVLHLHGGPYLTEEAIPGWARVLIRMAVQGRLTLVVLSESEKSTIENQYRCRKILVLANCVETDKAKEFEKDLPDSGTLNLLYYGRIDKSKGLQVIHEAMKYLLESEIDIKLYIAGRGPDEKKYIPAFRDLMKDRFVFMGVLSGEEKDSLLKLTDVFLLPSAHEGLPMALLESMCFGLVPIATPVGSVATRIYHGRNGFLISDTTGSELAGKIMQLYSDRELLQSMSRLSRRFSLIKCNVKTYITQLNQIYSDA